MSKRQRHLSTLTGAHADEICPNRVIGEIDAQNYVTAPQIAFSPDTIRVPFATIIKMHLRIGGVKKA